MKGINLADVRKVANQFRDSIACIAGTQFVELSVKDQKQEVDALTARK